MSLSILRKVLGFAVVVGVLAGVESAYAQTGGLTGKATGEDGQPLAKYNLKIERQDIKGVYSVKTNKRGEYIYIGLPLGNYRVTLQDPNGRDVVYLSTHVGMGDPTQLDFDMAKEKAHAAVERQKQLETNPELKKQQEQQENDTKQFTGLKQTFDQGNALMEAKKYDEAAAMYEQALPLAKEKNLPIVLAKLGESYQKAHQYPKAVENYQKAIAARPDDATLHNNLGNVYAEMGKVPEAAAEFKKAAEMDPTQASKYYFNYGAVMYNQGKMDEAAEALKKATEIDANYADAYFYLGQALIGKATMTPDGKIVAVPGTVEALETYLKLEPNGKNAAAAQQLLQTVQGQVQTQYKSQKKKKG
ncbi:MAG: tetratricopeptide repeat protein [Acidobacteriia bacterium]|nr:tetratricopeptide repeat protein [Terriglobia bacterium]